MGGWVRGVGGEGKPSRGLSPQARGGQAHRQALSPVRTLPVPAFLAADFLTGAFFLGADFFTGLETFAIGVLLSSGG